MHFLTCAACLLLQTDPSVHDPNWLRGVTVCILGRWSSLALHGPNTSAV